MKAGVGLTAEAEHGFWQSSGKGDPDRRDIRLHGRTDNHIEYSAYIAGTDAYQHSLCAISEEEGAELRLFSPDNDFVIGQIGVCYTGNGGSFCEYMFGVEQPISDMARKDVINRLVMYGAKFDDSTGNLSFSNRTKGAQSYERLFYEGNAVCNYFFYLHSKMVTGPLGRQQEIIAKLLGKVIKRSLAVGAGEDGNIIAELLPLVNDPGARLFLFKFINTKHLAYYNLFRTLYFKSKKISDEDFARLTTLAADLGIDNYQQERMRIDIMYKHPINRPIVDEYKSILIDCKARGSICRLDNARLTRLKTLSVRNKIPGKLFYTLDEVLKKETKMIDMEEAEYLAETRQILEGLFMHEQHIDSPIERDDLVKLLCAKKQATENRDHTFEEILLDTSKACDEKVRDGAGEALAEGFSLIINYFNRFNTTSSLISQLAFMENVRVNEEMLRDLLEDKLTFDSLTPGFFEDLFVTGLYCNKYLGTYGRRKVVALTRGLALIEEKRLAVATLLDQLLEIDDEERLFLTLLEHIRKRVRSFYSRYTTRSDQEILKREIAEELRKKKLLSGSIPDKLFRETILTIKKEAVYLHNLLPIIISEKNVALREDFLENSGLDRFYVEELEREYYEQNGLIMDELYQIRKGLS